MKPAILIDNDNTLIAEVRTDQTGGYIYNDIITLKDGTIIRISEDGLSVFKNAEADDNNDQTGFIYFKD